MATYTKVSRSIPNWRRSALIENVAAGDQVDVRDVLGRPARGVKFSMTATGDTITFKLNNLVRRRVFEKTEADSEELIWSSGDQYSTYSATGALEHVTEDGLWVDSFEVVSLSLSSGTTIDVVVW